MYNSALTASKSVFRSLAHEQGFATKLQAEIQNRVFDSCRATFISLSAEAGCDIPSMLQQMRSESPEMAARYQRTTGAVAAMVTGAINKHLQAIRHNAAKKDTPSLTPSLQVSSPSKRSRAQPQQGISPDTSLLQQAPHQRSLFC